MSNKPFHTIRDGALKITIWRNNKPEGDGFWYEFVPGRTYTDKSEKPKTAQTFSASDLLRLGELTRMAHHWELRQRAKDKSTDQQEAA